MLARRQRGGAIYIGRGVRILGKGAAGAAWPAGTRAAIPSPGRRRQGGGAGPLAESARGRSFFLNKFGGK